MQANKKLFHEIPESQYIQSMSADTQSNEKITSNNQVKFLTDSYPKITRILMVIFLLIFFATFYFWGDFDNLVTNRQLFNQKETIPLQQRFPKIFWVYTQNQRDAEDVEEDIYINYFDSFAKKAKYQVRYATSLTAYDFLSNQTIERITETMSKRTMDQTVNSFLKLALLYQHGGIMMQTGTILVSDNFTWIQHMFNKYAENPHLYACEPADSFFYAPKYKSQYKTAIVVAVPKSQLVKDLFDYLAQVVTSEQVKTNGKLSERYNIQGLYWNQQTGVYGFDNTLSNSLNHFLKINNKNNQKCYKGIQQPMVDMTLFVEQKTECFEVFVRTSGFYKLLKRRGLQRQSYVQAIVGLKRQKIAQTIFSLALGKYNRSSIQNTLLHKVISVPGNKQTILQDLPDRQIELCIVLMEPLTEQQIKHTFDLIKQQTYVKWKLVIPKKNIDELPLYLDPRITLMQQKSNKVHNIEKALTNHCPHKGYAVLLNYNQTFLNKNALQKIAKAASNRKNIGVYIPLQYKNQIHEVNPNFTYFYRIEDGIVNPKLDLMKHILNHLRVFSIQTFKTLPQYTMRDWNGIYYKDRIIFFMDFHDFIHRKIIKQNDLYLIKKNDNLWSIPTQVQILDNLALLRVNQFEEIDQQQLKITRPRVSTRSLRLIMSDLRLYKVSLKKIAVFNPGLDFTPIEQKKGPQIIPRIIHQIWLGGKIPPAKQYMLKKTAKLHPSYQIKLWGQQNITKQLFPTTYDIVRNLLEFNKRSPYNKLATVTDILRHEILYREGGIWKDAAFDILRPLPDSFLRYKLVLPTDRIYQARYLQGMCFFANIPKYQNLNRINNYRNLNQMRIHNKDPMPIAGPVDFRKLIVGEEEFYPQILLLPYQTFYPAQVYQHPDNDLCVTNKLKQGDKYEVEERGYYLLPGCEDKYPYAFGLQHINYGNSWVKPRTINP